MGYERVKHSHQVGDKHPGRNWTLEIMAGAIVAIRESGEPVNAGYLKKTLQPTLPSHKKSAWRMEENCWGSWL